MRASRSSLGERAFLGEEWATLGLGSLRALGELGNVAAVLSLSKNWALGISKGWAASSTIEWAL